MEDKIFVIDLSEDPVLTEDCEECWIDTSDTCLKQDCQSTENGTSVDSEVEKQASPSHCKMDNSLVVHHQNDIVDSETIIEEEKETKEDIIKSSTDYWYATYVFGVIIACAVPLSATILIPRNNVILYQNSWYETAIIYILVFSSLWSLYEGMEFTMYTGTTTWISFGIFLRFYVLIMLGCFLVCCISYIVFYEYLGYNLPVPLLYVWLILGAFIFSFIGIWTFSPTVLRAKKEYQKQLLFYVVYKFYTTFMMNIQVTLLNVGFKRVPYHWQWAVAIMIILVRDINHWFISKLIPKISNKNEDEVTNVLLSSQLSIQFGSMIAVQLTAANNVAVGSFLLFELFLHIRACYQVIRLHQSIESEENTLQIQKQMKKKLQKLVLDEIIEILILLVYSLGSAFVIYGPNQDIYAQFRNYEDFDTSHLFSVMSIMMMFESAGSIICGFILKRYCKTNLFSEFCDLMKRFWFIIAIRLAWTMTGNLSASDSNVGTTFRSHKMGWLTDDGRKKIILDSIYLTHEEKNMILDNITLF